MKRSVFRMMVLLVVGAVCVGVLILKFGGISRAALAGNFASEPQRSTSPRQSVNVELVGHIAEGNLTSIVVQGQYAYVKDDFYSPTCFHIIDISDPANPIEVGAYSLSNCFSFDVSGSYAYVLQVTDPFSPMRILHVIDMADLANPVDVGTYSCCSGDNITGLVAVYYPYVYFYTAFFFRSQWTSQIWIVNVADPANITLVKDIDVNGVTGIIFRGRYIYMTTVNYGYTYACITFPGFEIYDNTDPTNPGLITTGSVTIAGDEAIAGSYAYLAGDNCIDSIYQAIFVEDISDPYFPTRVNVLPDYYGNVNASGHHLFIARNTHLYDLDTTNPVTPEEVGYYEFSGSIYDYAISDGYIYVTSSKDGLYILRQTRTISGQITDANQIPYPGVEVKANHGLSTTVGADGYYTFTNVITGTYTITPTYHGYTFLPASRSLTVPSLGALSADFTILPKYITIALTTGLTSTLTITDTQGLTTTLLFPAGAVTETVSLTLTPTLATSQLSWIFAGHAFDLAASHEGVPLPDFAFSVPVTVTIHYSDVDTRLVDEGRLALWEWVGNTWQDAVQVCQLPAGYQHDEAGNVLRLAICRVGTFKLMGPTYPVFLPVVSSP